MIVHLDIEVVRPLAEAACLLLQEVEELLVAFLPFLLQLLQRDFWFFLTDQTERWQNQVPLILVHGWTIPVPQSETFENSSGWCLATRS